MDFFMKETTSSDGQTVHDVQLVTNGKSSVIGENVCIFTCTSKGRAGKFMRGLNKLVEMHTVEVMEPRDI